MFVDLTVVIDRSGSMSTMGGAPLESLKVFIKEQQEAAIADDRLGTTTLRVVTFDDRVEIAYAGPLAAASINAEAVRPRGPTRLLDTAAEEIIAQRTRVDALRVEREDVDGEAVRAELVADALREADEGGGVVEGRRDDERGRCARRRGRFRERARLAESLCCDGRC